jgi:hypothetical protein
MIKDTSKRPFSQISSATTEDKDPTDSAPLGRGHQGHSGGQGGRGHQGRGDRGGGRGRGEPWREEITTRCYQGQELARMTDDQRHQMRERRKGRQIGATETSGQPGTADPSGHPNGLPTTRIAASVPSLTFISTTATYDAATTTASYAQHQRHPTARPISRK